jgi:hypothetical protein
MIKWEIFLQKEGAFRICNKEGCSDIKKRENSLICENTPYFKKSFENMAAESGSLPLKVGEFTCMLF